MSPDPTLDARQSRARDGFFFPPDDPFHAVRECAASSAGNVARIALAFVHNLTATSTLVSLPFTMASVGVHQRRYQAILGAERIRMLKHKHDGLTDEVRDARAREAADQRMREELASKERRTEHACAVLSDLGHHLEDPVFARAAGELVRQALVLTWGALEVLARDVHHVRFAPAESPRVRAALMALLPGEPDARALMQKWNVWLLFNRRHLVVHRCGIVDAEYLDQTGDAAQRIGSMLHVTPEALEGDMRSVAEFGVALLLGRTPPTR